MKEPSEVCLAMPRISLWDIKTSICNKNCKNECSAIQRQTFRFPNAQWNSQPQVRRFVFRKSCMTFKLKCSSEWLQSRGAKLVLVTVGRDKYHIVIGLTAGSVLSVDAQTWLGIDWQDVKQIEACSLRNAEEIEGSTVGLSLKGIIS